MSHTCNCCGKCGRCGGNCRPRGLVLSPIEYRLLLLFAAIPFYPVGFAADSDIPIFREADFDDPQIGAALLQLERKSLISIDLDIPLQGCQYENYRDCAVFGSAALTARGQEVTEWLEFQAAFPSQSAE